jgi:hypothetical protein
MMWKKLLRPSTQAGTNLRNREQVNARQMQKPKASVKPLALASQTKPT